MKFLVFHEVFRVFSTLFLEGLWS